MKLEVLAVVRTESPVGTWAWVWFGALWVPGDRSASAVLGAHDTSPLIALTALFDLAMKTQKQQAYRWN